jgi:hypothetical protein
MWYFEILDILHKLILTSLLRFFSPGYQLPVGLGVCVLFIVAILLQSPYVRKSYDLLMLAVLTEILLVMLICHVIDSTFAEVGMPPAINLILSVAMIIIVIFTLIIGLLQLCTYARKVHRTMKRRKVTAKGSSFEGPDDRLSLSTSRISLNSSVFKSQSRSGSEKGISPFQTSPRNSSGKSFFNVPK